MTTPQKEQMAELVVFFKTLGERQQLSESLEAEITAHEARLEGQCQEAARLAKEKRGLEQVIAELETRLMDLTSAVPSAAQVVELRLTETRQAVADEAEQLLRIQAYQQSLKQQISDAEDVLRDLKNQIAGLSEHLKVSVFTPALSLTGPAIISPAPTIPDYEPLRGPEEAAS
jgi:chromosome segregation ATPase